ncbi:MAG TPA: transcription repressor NadR [Clostridiales bacterium]|nr:transcription repressor NadR [Clostridiales bacterium]
MSSEQRRRGILKILEDAEQPVTGSELSRHFQVSRQVIVQDIALLRAKGHDILATPQGYMLSPVVVLKKPTRILPCKHTQQQIRDELMTIVQLGGKILDVIIEHKIYGQFTGTLMIDTPEKVDDFVEKLNKEQAEPLSLLTDGVHLHTIEAEHDHLLDNIEHALAEKGYLLENI